VLLCTAYFPLALFSWPGYCLPKLALPLPRTDSRSHRSSSSKFWSFRGLPLPPSPLFFSHVPVLGGLAKIALPPPHSAFPRSKAFSSRPLFLFIRSFPMRLQIVVKDLFPPRSPFLNRVYFPLFLSIAASADGTEVVPTSFSSPSYTSSFTHPIGRKCFPHPSFFFAFYEMCNRHSCKLFLSHA